MHADVPVALPVLFGFLFVLARVAGVFVFVPLPGMKRGVEMARVVLALGITLALYPRWPAAPAEAPIGAFAFGLIAEAALGITIGLAVAFLLEGFLLGAQIISSQAGFSYASMVNPVSDTESGVLLVLAELAAGLLFFALGLDRQVLRAVVASFDLYPPGAFLISRPLAETVLGLGAVMFSTGLRLAFPAIALLGLVDLALALLGRLQPGLQLINLAFPAKTLAGLAIAAWLAGLMPRLLAATAASVFAALRHAAGL